MLMVTTNEDSGCAKLLGLTGNSKSEGGLICSTTSLLAPIDSDGGYDTCSFYSGPSDAAIIAFGESAESCGSIAYCDGSESSGSVGYYGGAESCGSIASSGGGASFGGGCSYSC